MKQIIISFLIAFSSLTYGQDWVENLSEAKQFASEKNQNIVLVFSGSDWCIPCIKLDKTILSTSEFHDLSKDHFVMVKVDFPRKKKNQLAAMKAAENRKLAEAYNPKGYFPLVVILDKEGNPLGEIGYENVSPSEYFRLLSSFES